MEIICCGFWKTGTKSLAEALKILGYRVYDFDELLIEFPNLWKHFFDGTVTDDEIKEALKDVDVMIDGPTIPFWYEVHKCFPEAKLILSIRDADGWYRSYKDMRSIENTWAFRCCIAYFSYIPASSMFWRTSLRAMDFVVGESKFNDNPRLYKLKYNMHNSFVRDKAPKNLLLELKVGAGWGSLCQFLNVEQPDVPYPYKNKGNTVLSDEMPPGMKKLFLRAFAQFACFMTAVVGGASYAVYLWMT